MLWCEAYYQIFGLLVFQDQWQQNTIPLNLHGDAVPTVGCGKVWSKMMQAYSWAGLLTVGSTQERSFFIFGAAVANLLGLLSLLHFSGLQCHIASDLAFCSGI